MKKQAIRVARLAGVAAVLCILATGCRGSSGKPWWDFWSKDQPPAAGPMEDLTQLPPPPTGSGADISTEGLEIPPGSMDLANARPTGGAAESVEALQTVYFSYDKADLEPGEQAKLESSASWLKMNAGTQVLLEGHCDERGTREYNFALGERRAIAVREFLAAKGVAPQNLKVISYGKDRPIDPGHNEAAYAKNRRVQFLVYK